MSAVRIYTATFGKNLLKAYTSWLAKPAGDRADLRGREVVDLSLSDKEIFEGLQGEDEWIESGMHEVFEYLYRGTRLVFLDLYGFGFQLAAGVSNGGLTYMLHPKGFQIAGSPRCQTMRPSFVRKLPAGINCVVSHTIDPGN